MKKRNREKPAPAFFRMDRGDRIYLAALLFFAGISFLPWWRGIDIAGMALFGWLMAVLMFIAPVVAFIRYIRRKNGGQSERIGQ